MKGVYSRWRISPLHSGAIFSHLPHEHVRCYRRSFPQVPRRRFKPSFGPCCHHGDRRAKPQDLPRAASCQIKANFRMKRQNHLQCLIRDPRRQPRQRRRKMKVVIIPPWPMKGMGRLSPWPGGPLETLSPEVAAYNMPRRRLPAPQPGIRGAI